MINQKLLDKFQDYLIVKDCSEGTIKNYKIAVEQLINYTKKQPKDITQRDLDGYKVYLKQKYEQNSIIPKIHGVNNFLKLIEKKCKLKAPKYLMKNRDCLTKEEIKSLFESAKDHPRDNAILKILYYTGIRRNELMNLNIEDIDFEKQKLSINAGKGNTYDKINIHPVALESIKQYLSKRKTPIDGHEKALFLTYMGKRMGHMSIDQLVKKYGAKAKITKRIYPHLFRASLITHMDENGASMMEIKAQSRHKDIKTLEIYIRHSEEHIKNVYMNTVPTFDRSRDPKKSIPKPKRIEPIPQQQNKEDKYIDLLREGLITRDDFLKLVGLDNQQIEGYV